MTKSDLARESGAKDFMVSTAGIELAGISPEVLLKLLAHQLTDHDRQPFMEQVVNHNRELFIVDARSKKFGVPGFYRVVE